MSNKGFCCPDSFRLHYIVPTGFKKVKMEVMASAIPKTFMERYSKLDKSFEDNEWFIDSLSADTSTICAFWPRFHIDCHCLFYFGFIRPKINSKKRIKSRTSNSVC